MKMTERSLKVLVIDDDPDVGQFLTEFLSRRGYSVTVISDPEKALGALNTEMFQIVLLDIVMPKLDGLEVLKRIRQNDSDICVIMLSGHPTFERAVQSFKDKAFDFITKPFEIDDLTSVLERAAEHYGFVSDLSDRACRQIAEKVKDSRQHLSLSMRQLASRAGISPSLVYQIEHCQTTPSLTTVCRLAVALGLKLEDLFEGL